MEMIVLSKDIEKDKDKKKKIINNDKKNSKKIDKSKDKKINKEISPITNFNNFINNCYYYTIYKTRNITHEFYPYHNIIYIIFYSLIDSSKR